jgi:hypothetical protein
MQTTTRTAPRGRNDFPERNITLGNHTGDRHPKKNHSQTGRTGNDFLKTTFHVIPATRCYPVFNKDNYNYLLASAENYSKLLGSSFDFISEEKDFTGLFKHFETLLPERQILSITENRKRLSFKIGFGDGFLFYEVFFIPIELLNRTEGTFRDILLCFFQHFGQTYHFPKKENLFDYEMIVGNFEEWYNREDDLERWDFLRAYRDGYINDTFNLLYQKPSRSIKELKKLINGYKAKTVKEKQLIASIKQGIKIINRNKDIFSSVSRPEYPEDEDEYCWVSAERLIRFTYFVDDIVSDSYLEIINEDSNEFGNEYFPGKSLTLSPDTNTLLEIGFVECFFTWLSNFIKILSHDEGL